MSEATPGDERLLALRRRADEDFASPPAVHEQGRHTAEIAELGLRVSITRSLYPNRRGGRDLYAVTVSRIAVGVPPDEPAVQRALTAAFGAGAGAAEERPGGSAVRMFRVPAETVTG